MDVLASVPWAVLFSDEETSNFIALDEGTNEVNVEVRSKEGAVVNYITREGETIFLGQGDRVRVAERLIDAASVEIVSVGTASYRATVQKVFETEVLDPTPAVVVERLTERDQVAILVREEIARRLGELRDQGVFKDQVDVDELLEDALKGDHEFEEDEDDFVSMSYEDMAEERVTPDDHPPEVDSGTDGSVPEKPAPSGASPEPSS